MPILLSYLRLMLGIFIANVFHTIAKTSSIIFYLCQQFFAATKIFELERLPIPLFFILSAITQEADQR